MTIQIEVVAIFLIATVLCLSFMYFGYKVNALDPYQKPQGAGSFAITIVTMLRNVVMGNMGQRGERYAPYVITIFLYILISNMSSLFGLPAPTANLSVTLSFGIISWLLIQSASIKTNGIKGYLKGFFEPIFPFVIPNIFGLFAPLISMSLRLFGNVIGGGVIMTLLYTFLNYLNGILFPWLKVNLLGGLVAPILHLYFDIFSAFLQAFIFISLTTILTSVEFPTDEN